MRERLDSNYVAATDGVLGIIISSLYPSGAIWSTGKDKVMLLLTGILKTISHPHGMETMLNVLFCFSSINERNNTVKSI